MSANIEQIYVANPVSTIGTTDLLYVGQGGTADAAINGANFLKLFTSPTIFVVDASGGAEYNTISSAITAAVATTPTASNPALIWVRSGTYTENVTLPDYVYLIGASYGSVYVIGTMTYSGTNKLFVQNIIATQTSGAATFTSSTIGKPVLIDCILNNTGGVCYNSTAASTPILFNTQLNAGTGAKQFNLSSGCIVGISNSQGTYINTASTLNNSGLIIENSSISGPFILIGSELNIANSSVGTSSQLGTQNIAYASIDATSTVIVTQSSILSTAPSINAFTGTGTLIADAMALTGSQTGIDSGLTFQGNTNYCGSVAIANNFVNAFSSVVTANATTTLTINSPSLQKYTGTNAQTIVLPDATKCHLGLSYRITNTSSGNLTIQNAATSNIVVTTTGQVAYITCINNTTSAGNWDISWGVPGGVLWANSLLEIGSPALANNFSSALNSVVTAAGTTVLNQGSNRQWRATGTDTQTFQLPNTSLLALGWSYDFINDSTNAVLVVASDSSIVCKIGSGSRITVICSSILVTTNAGWDVSSIDATFTPGLEFGGLSTGIAGTFTGNYSQVGNTISFSITINLTNKGSATGNATITNLPAPGRVSVANQNFYLSGIDLTFTSFTIGALAGAQDYITLYDVISVTGGVPLTDADFSNTTTLFLSGTYLV